MGRRGPAKTPTAVLLARGSDVGRDRAASEVALPPGCPECPADFGASARECWQYVCEALVPVGALSQADRMALIVLADMYQQWTDASAHVRKHGATYEMDQGGQKIRAESPEARRSKQLAGELRLQFAQFGLTPSGRAGLSLPAGRPKPTASTAAKPGDSIKARVFGGA